MATAASDIRSDRAFRLSVATIRDLRVQDPSGSGDGSWIIDGYASTFGDEYVLYDGRWFRMRERVHERAFDDVLERVRAGEELVHLNHGHDMTSAVAATDVAGIGGLELSVDSHGFRFVARVDADDPDAVRMAAKLRRKVVAQASFAFTIDEEEVLIRELDDGRDDELYTILKIGHLYDVCVCAQGANPYTESSLRSLAAASLRVPDLGTLGRSPTGEGHQGRPSSEGGPGPVASGDEPAGRAASLSLLRAKVDDTDRRLRLEGAQ